MTGRAPCRVPGEATCCALSWEGSSRRCRTPLPPGQDLVFGVEERMVRRAAHRAKRTAGVGMRVGVGAEAKIEEVCCP